MRGGSAAPVGKLELDHADRILGELAHAARLLADAAVDRLEPVEGKHALLDLGHETVFLVEGEVAARVHDDLSVVGLDLGEEFHAAAELTVGNVHREQKHRCQCERHAGIAQRKPHRAHIGPAVTHILGMRHRRLYSARGLAEQCPQRRREEERDRKRGRQRRDQRDRQIFHELADHARPEQERRERGNASRSGGDHRPGHALGG